MTKTRKIVCKVCGAVFETALPNKKYCSPECREIGEKERRKTYAASYQTEYMRQRRARKKRQANGPA